MYVNYETSQMAKITNISTVTGLFKESRGEMPSDLFALISLSNENV